MPVEPSFFSELFGTKVRYRHLARRAASEHSRRSLADGLRPRCSSGRGAIRGRSRRLTAGCVFVGGLCAWLAPETNRADLTQLDHERLKLATQNHQTGFHQ
ncbi:hypothetical protein L0Z14_30330 [Burkholderia multivorans]|uniref:hypothetical protein n=1 Tax=Burkholderia multivorans TaxID=87883 RepID=UPI00201AC3B0|nr:hypothetical protein [Burkholderia multivorans]MCL4665197.1 hypothetical protein [Burkholderia multivorans]